VTDKTLSIETVEIERLRIQNQLDGLKTQAERNKLGQFATPTVLATDILEYAKTLLSETEQIRFLDPAFGTGSFYAALLRSFPLSRIVKAWGYEIDPHYGQPASKLWRDTPLELKIDDFTKSSLPVSDNERANLFICNPPYVRHHHLSADQKLQLQISTKRITGLKLNGLSGLYCYFLLVSHAWLAEGGLAGWLIPSEFMDVNYGKQIKHYLLHQVTLLRIHRFNPDEVQFDDALVSSAVVWFRKQKPPKDHRVEFSYGGTLTNPELIENISVDTLNYAAKWSSFPKILTQNVFHYDNSKDRIKPKLADLFRIKRGLATGANKFFILSPRQITEYELPSEFLTPILPSPRYLLSDEIAADQNGHPILDLQLFLLTCNLPENQIKAEYPSLWKYLELGIQQDLHNRYLCRHRSPWYSQEQRPAAPFLCTYMGRRKSSLRNNRPFRFILNHSSATAPNVYLMLYPKPMLEKELKNNPALFRAVWQALQDISPDILMDEGRVYGGGLHKIEPNELANAPADNILAIIPKLSDNNYVKQLTLFEQSESKRYP
jgi:adenine-specific DNA-methyltransferase